MEIKPITVADIIETERQMVLHGAEQYGAYYINAFEFNNLFEYFIKSVNPNHFIFTMFLGQIRKHHLLAIFSAVRLHNTQAMMNLRQVLEAGSCAAYAIVIPNVSDFTIIDENEILHLSKELTTKRYKWLEKNFKKSSDNIKNMKKIINDSDAHSSIISAHQNFQATMDEGRYVTSFFDITDDYFVKIALWQIANVALSLFDLFRETNKKAGSIKFSDNFLSDLKTLGIENNRLKAELMSTDRFKNAQKI